MGRLARYVAEFLFAIGVALGFAKNAGATWSGSHNIGVGQYNYWFYGECHFGGLNDSKVATTQWVATSPEGCIGLRVTYQYDVPGYPVTPTWSSYKYAAPPTSPSVSYSKSSTQRMLASGHSGEI